MVMDDRTDFEIGRDWRYEALLRLGQQYELGEMSDEEFKRLKRQILHGTQPSNDIHLARGEMVIATYMPQRPIDAVLDRLKFRWDGPWSPIIDAALILVSVSESIRIRVESELTRPILRGQISIAAAVCGLLFPLDVLLRGHARTPLAASFDAFAAPEPQHTHLRSIGSALPPNSVSILAVCWSSVAEGVAGVLTDADYLERYVFCEEITSAIAHVLTSAGVEGNPANSSHH